MKKGLLAGLLMTILLPVKAQKAIIEESVTDIVCDGPTHAIVHYKEVTTIPNEQGASKVSFACTCSKKDRLTSFKGVVTDANGRVIRKMKESELQKTELSPYFAIDDYTMYLDYTPPVYPVTVSYEWTIDSRDNLIAFPRFCPQTDYDVSVKKASYSLKAPKSMTILHAEQIIVLDEGKIVGKGTHKELLRSCDTYKQIASSQLSEAELEKSIGGEDNE